MSSMKSNNSGIPRKTPLNPLAQSSTKSSAQIKVKTVHSHSHNINTKQKGKNNVSNKHGSIKPDEPIAKSILKLEEDHKRMKAILEGTVKDAEEKLEYMKSLVQKSVQVTKDESEKVSEEKQSPHEGENDENLVDVNACDGIKERHYITKSKLKSMREKLQEMNSKTQMFMDEAEKMTQDINEIEAMSIRIGSSVEDVNDDMDDVKKEPSDKNTNSMNTVKHTHTNTVFITETAEDSH